ncbi:CoA pyrophosphatase [Flavobacterium sp. CS20]|jgi:8-oxo-dGTP pyrophosphatase MutT (NUDIX family)|uniref:NUDIX hydrolase n=1 Tax=Flavobacterium sp. CS20 TaxID=2775246 RepID=UPI001B3A5C02|nr:CoA pyrophosphatase [Flavobacterium sp. CS20]QTY27417.1 CoA pyrophosphatase [Flavobacterium sp. CS20]
MQFSYIEQFFPKIKKIDLPGEKAQALMAPESRKISLTQKYDFLNANRAGVLILFFPDSADDVNFVLILRKTYKGVHSNQVALPGGRYENEDRNLIQTALRETEEEVGVASSSVEVIRPMTELYIPPSNFLVKPTLAKIDYQPVFTKQESEVEKIIPVKLKDFILPSCIKTRSIQTSHNKEKQVPIFDLNGHVVWGATAMMLSELREILKQLQLI